MDDATLKLLKEELTTQLQSYGFNENSKNILNDVTNNDHINDMTKPNDKFDTILSAKNEWESCVDALKYQAIVILDKNLKVIRTNRTIETWGWADVTTVRGTHILNLITPAIQHASSQNWIDEWCQLDTQSNAEWVSNNFKSDKTYRFSFFPNRDIDSLYHNDNCYAVMLITDISNQNTLKSEDNHPTINNNDTANESGDTDLIRLSAYRLHQLANKLIQSQENERKRVSSELHDGLGQLLSALKYKVELAVIESEKKVDEKENNVVLNDILQNVTFALSELRRVSTDLRPSVLEDLGILMTLRWFTNEYNKIYTDLNVDLQLDITEMDIPEEIKSVIYRIVQESMNNIAKHSDAGNIFVYLAKSESGILLRIKDDGCGFDLKKVKQSKKTGLGLKSMEERAVNSGAKFTMKSGKISGTIVQVFWSED